MEYRLSSSLCDPIGRLPTSQSMRMDCSAGLYTYFLSLSVFDGLIWQTAADFLLLARFCVVQKERAIVAFLLFAHLPLFWATCPWICLLNQIYSSPIMPFWIDAIAFLLLNTPWIELVYQETTSALARFNGSRTCCTRRIVCCCLQSDTSRGRKKRGSLLKNFSWWLFILVHQQYRERSNSWTTRCTETSSRMHHELRHRSRTWTNVFLRWFFGKVLFRSPWVVFGYA